MAILAARPYKPRDKAKVEQSRPDRRALDSGPAAQSAVLQRLADLNVAIGELVGDINARVMRGYGASRAELFAAIDKPALKALPDEPYAFARLEALPRRPRLPRRDRRPLVFHPFRLIRELVDVAHRRQDGRDFPQGTARRQPCRARRTGAAIRRSPITCRALTAATPRGRRPASIAYAEKIGPSTAALFEAIMAARPHPEQGFRTCLGILALTRTYGDARVDAACRRGISIKARSVASIRSILKNGLDRAFLDEDERPTANPCATATSAAGAISTEPERIRDAYPSHP